tara:strand:- start:70 stop:510 length:441 start_codon:yes stop_codon:yes gene_type:complete
MTKISIKRLSDKAQLPVYETSGASGMDLAALIDEDIIMTPGERVLVPTGLAVSIPKGFEIQIRPRSGLAAKKGVTVINTPGTIDADYRGEIKIILVNLSKDKFVIENGLRIAQMVVSPVVQVKLEEVEELSETSRGSDGFGSTGTK